jgi:hypothetical protein
MMAFVTLLLTMAGLISAPKARQLYGHWMTEIEMDKTVGEYLQEPAEQKHLLEATVVSLGPHVGNPLLLLQPATISAIPQEELVAMPEFVSTANPQHTSRTCATGHAHHLFQFYNSVVFV